MRKKRSSQVFNQPEGGGTHRENLEQERQAPRSSGQLCVAHGKKKTKKCEYMKEEVRYSEEEYFFTMPKCKDTDKVFLNATRRMEALAREVGKGVRSKSWNIWVVAEMLFVR